MMWVLLMCVVVCSEPELGQMSLELLQKKTTKLYERVIEIIFIIELLPVLEFYRTCSVTLLRYSGPEWALQKLTPPLPILKLMMAGAGCPPY
jgi:hypothetical protein